MRLAIFRLAGMAIIVLVVVAVMAPAAWVADLLESRGPVRLVHPSGTVWTGSALIGFTDGQQLRLLPGRVTWQVRASTLLSGRLAVELQHEMADRPINLQLERGSVHVAAGNAQVPAALLAVLGAPFNTVRPGGTLRAQWDNMRFGDHGFQGSFQVDWVDAQSAMSNVAPLGSYRLVANAQAGRGEAELMTLGGPLLLRGKGNLDRGGIRFSGVADAQQDMRASLDGFIGLLGRRMNGHVLLEWEIRR